MKTFWRNWKWILVPFIALWILLTTLLYSVGYTIDKAGGVQCVVGKIWNSSQKIEGCK